MDNGATETPHMDGARRRLRVVDHLGSGDAFGEFVCPIHERILALACAVPLLGGEGAESRTKRAQGRLIVHRYKEGVVPCHRPHHLREAEAIE
jgi:hypothetical protein